MKDNFEWVWPVRAVRVVKGEMVPMDRGDRIYIKIDDNNTARFHRRMAKSNSNDEVWEQATGTYDPKTSDINGQMPDGTTFTMHLQEGNGVTYISAEHKRNPGTGDWTGDDDEYGGP